LKLCPYSSNSQPLLVTVWSKTKFGISKLGLHWPTYGYQPMAA